MDIQEICNVNHFNEIVTLFSYFSFRCGDGDVLPSTTGLRIDGAANKSQVARSPYFKAFRLFDEREIRYQCYYLVCEGANVCEQVRIVFNVDVSQRKNVNKAHVHEMKSIRCDIPSSVEYLLVL